MQNTNTASNAATNANTNANTNETTNTLNGSGNRPSLESYTPNSGQKFNTYAGVTEPKATGFLTQPAEDMSVEQVRRYRLERLAASFRLFAHFGYDEGVAGHITVRDPEEKDMFWVNPIGMHFSQIKVSDLLLVNHHGEVVQGQRPVNVAAFAIHSRLHMAREDVVSAAHSHSNYGRGFAALKDTELLPITQDSCAFFERVSYFDEFSGVVDETSEGDKIANCLGENDFMVLKNHGLLTTGTSVEAAVWFFMSMEKCCKTQMQAMAAGNVQTIPEQIARKTRDYIASDYSAWLSFQPLWDLMIAKDPNFLN